MATDRTQVPEFLAQKKYSWKFVYDGNGVETYKVAGIPVVLFIDRDGNLVERFNGAADEADWDAALARIL